MLNNPFYIVPNSIQLEAQILQDKKSNRAKRCGKELVAFKIHWNILGLGAAE